MRLRPVLVLALLVLPAACAELGDPDVVTIGRERLSVRDLRREYAELSPPERRSLSTRAARMAFVDATVDRRLLEARGRELAREDPAAVEDLQRQRDELLVRRLRMLEGGERTLDPAARERAVERLSQEQLVERAWFATRSAAEAARRSVQEGDPLDRAAREQHGLTAQAAEWMRWSPFPDPVTDAAADIPVGEISQPVADGPRWVLLRVIDRREVETPPTQEEEDAIARGVRTREASGRLDALVRRLRDEAHVRVLGETVGFVARRTEEAILDGDAGSLDHDWALPRLDGDDGDRVLAEWDGGGRLTVREYVDEIARWITLQRPQLHLDTEIRSACERAVDARLLLAEAKRRRLESEWWAGRALARLERARYVQLAVERIDSGAPDLAEADSVAALLHSSQPSLFHREARARILRIELTDERVARQERERVLAAGGGRARLAEILESKAAVAGTYRVLSLTRAEIEDPAVAARLFDGPPGELIGPVEVSGLWVLMETWKRYPARELTPEEILAEVRQRMRRGGDRATVDRWLAARREEVGVAVDEQALDRLAPGV